jgi:hypothetical protein
LVGLLIKKFGKRQDRDNPAASDFDCFYRENTQRDLIARRLWCQPVGTRRVRDTKEKLSGELTNK